MQSGFSPNSRVPHFSRPLREVGILTVSDGHSSPSPLTLIVWSGHSCPLLLTLLLVLLGKGTVSSHAETSHRIISASAAEGKRAPK